MNVQPAVAADLDHRCRIRDAAGGLISPHWCISDFADALTRLPEDLTADQVLRPELRLYADDKGLEVYYTPFELVFRAPRVILVGVTPGRQQLFVALREAAAALRQGATATAALERASRVGSFAGPSRTNLVKMLDGIGLHRALGVTTTATAFDDPTGAVASTSAISHAVLRRGRDYTGHSPRIDRPPILQAFITQVLAQQLAAAPEALVIPLGKAASIAVDMCVAEGAARAEQCLLRFPHPSGQNGTREESYRLHRDDMARQLESWFGRSGSHRSDGVTSLVPAQPAPSQAKSTVLIDQLRNLLNERATGHGGSLVELRDDGTVIIRALLRQVTKSRAAAFEAASDLHAEILRLGFVGLAGTTIAATNGVRRPEVHPAWWFGVLHMSLSQWKADEELHAGQPREGSRHR